MFTRIAKFALVALNVYLIAYIAWGLCYIGYVEYQSGGLPRTPEMFGIRENADGRTVTCYVGDTATVYVRGSDPSPEYQWEFSVTGDACDGDGRLVTYSKRDGNWGCVCNARTPGVSDISLTCTGPDGKVVQSLNTRVIVKPTW